MLTAGLARGSLAACALALALLLAPATPTAAANPEAVPPHPQRDIEFYGWWHDAGQLWLHTSNLAFFGTFASSPGEPSASWPLDSGYEHLYAAGIWLGAVCEGDTLVSTSVFQMEFRPPAADPLYTIYTSSAGNPGGDKYRDDDSDGAVDEDRLDGFDNDGDSLVDEDFAAISDQMFAYVAFDTVAIENPNPNDPHTPMGLEVFVQSFAWGDGTADDFVGARYEIRNIGRQTLEGVYAGLMVDPDVGFGEDSANCYLDDLVGYADTTVQGHPSARPCRVVMAHAHDAPGGDDGDWNGWFGVVLLDHSETGQRAPDLHAFRIWSSGPDDPRDDADRYDYLSNPTIDTDVSTPADWRFLFSMGPFDELTRGEIIFFEVAYVCGSGFEGLLENAANAVRRHRGKLWSDSARPKPRPLGQPLPRSAARERVEGLVPPSPNPARETTRISYSLAESGRVELSVYDCAGRRVAELFDGEVSAGTHHVDWSSGLKSLPAGVYLVRLRIGEACDTTKLILLH